MVNTTNSQGAVLELAQRFVADRITRVSPGWGLVFTIASQVANSENASSQLREMASSVQAIAIIAVIAELATKP